MHLSKLVLMAVVMSALASANTVLTLTIDVVEDGWDQLVFSGNTLQWVHRSDFANGGVAGGSVPGLVNVNGATVTANNPYITVTGTAAGDYNNPFSANWYNGMQGLNCSTLPGGTCPYSQPVAYEYTLPSPYSLTNLVGNVALNTLVCAGAAGTSNCNIPVVRDPAPTIANNAGNWIVNLDDRPASGTHEFKVQLSWTVTPEPESFVLVGLGMGALVVLRRKLT